jgi:two-component system, chemotaxis family, CheB/CheR fusion protein
MTEPEDEENGNEVAREGLDELLAYLVESRGFDFVDYKRTGLQRRLGRRLAALGLSSYLEYVDYLQVHPDEFSNLCNAILINATGFYRDPSAWEYVAEQVIPRIAESKRNAPIRIWSAGCATGQEAYSIAMLLADALGLAALGRWVKIYATDVDGDALSQARQAIYRAKDLAPVPERQIAKYFEPNADQFSVVKDLRRCVIFGQHNLLSDAPISRVDLLLCRNTLMYFNADAQSRILSNLHFALNESGVLFLGKAEMLLTHGNMFTPIDKRRLFSKVSHSYPRSRALPLMGVGSRSDDRNRTRSEQALLRDAVFDAAPLPQLGFDASGRLSIANAQARTVLGILPGDMGRAPLELRLGRKIEKLDALVDKAAAQHQPVPLPSIEWTRAGGESQFFDILATPLMDEGGAVQGVLVSFTDVSALSKLALELAHTSEELQGAHEELQSTSEELETTNEELQSTVEELETTNEELQSTNEELETTNAELRSTNEELQSINEEFRIRSADLGRLNLYFESILTSLHSAVVVLDLNLNVQVWSNRAQELWGLRPEEVTSKHLLGLDIGLPVDQLMGPIRTCLNSERDHQEVTLHATNRRGRSIRCRVSLSRLNQTDQPSGVILLMNELEPSQPEHKGDGKGESRKDNGA